MFDLFELLQKPFDLVLVVLAFGAIIAIHEFGHFIAARWAGIRVMAFAVGMGPALCSWRKGMGFRKGSSEAEYMDRLAAQVSTGVPARGGVVDGVYPTEYRLNLLPLGGYVKMLGQDDMDPTQRSEEADSYQRCVPWKRMIVISAGVVANIITAAAFFVIAFSIGLKDVAPIIGDVSPGRPAATAVAHNAAELGVTTPGLQPRDVVVSIAGEKPETFADVGLAVAMSARGQKIDLEVQRPGVPQLLRFSIEPAIDPVGKMLSLGITPAASGSVYGTETRLNTSTRQQNTELLAARGLPGVEPDMVLSRVGGLAAEPGAMLAPHEIDLAAERGGGKPISIAFRSVNAEKPGEVSVSITPVPELQYEWFAVTDAQARALPHLLGLVPAMTVDEVIPEGNAAKAGLKAGDVFARIGDIEWPSVAEGIAEIQRAAKSVRISVWRAAPQPGDAAGSAAAGEFVDLGDVPVTRGTIGFRPSVAASERSGTRLARWPLLKVWDRDAAKPGKYVADAERPSGARLDLPAGARIVSIEGRSVASFPALRAALRDAAAASGSGDVRVTLGIEIDAEAGTINRQVVWTIAATERAELLKLTWLNPLPPDMWEMEKTVMKATGIADALGRGLSRTHKVMLNVYLTFARLFQGTVKLEHLQGPVGIAHAGTIFAERGYPWLLFFMALVSVNLAVINFLPMPIVDGGHMVFLLWEHFTGRPVSVAVQNAATLAGLVMIGSLFLLVTYNDIVRLIW